MNWCFLFSIPYIISLIWEATVTVMKKRWEMSKMSNLHHSYNFPRLWKKMLRRIFLSTIFYFGTTLNFARSWFSYSIKKKKIALNAFRVRDWRTGMYCKHSIQWKDPNWLTQAWKITDSSWISSWNCWFKLSKHLIFKLKKAVWLTRWFFVFKIYNLLVDFCNIQLIVIWKYFNVISFFLFYWIVVFQNYRVA